MLSAPDADLVRRDAGIPGLGAVLDPDRFLDRVRESFPDREPRTARITYVKYDPGVSCRVGYELDAPGGTFLAHATASDGIVLSIFPHDRRLKALLGLDSASGRRRLLADVVPGARDLRKCTVECVRYRPERRFVGRVVVDGLARALLKIYLEREYPDASRAAAAFRSRGALRVPETMGSSDRYRAIAFEWLAGRPLLDVLAEGPARTSTAAEIGAALAELHVQEPTGLPAEDAAARARGFRQTAEWLAIVRPELAGLARELAERLVALDAGDLDSPRPLHGDFSPRQILVEGSRVAVVDTDTSHRGNPAEDLGSFLARLRRHAPARADSFGEAFLEGYRRATRRPLPGDLPFFLAADCFRLAPHAFRQREPDWPRRTAEMLEAAAEALGAR